MTSCINKWGVKFLFPILSGILLALAFPPFNLWFLVFIALIPLFWIRSFWNGFLAGIVFFGILFSWLFAAYPFEWLSAGASKTEILILLIFLYTIQTVFLGLFLGIFAWSSKLSFKKFTKLSFLLIPALWIVLEYLRAWGFGILYLGKETLFGPHWTFGNLAYALHNQTRLIQIADLGGIYLLSFLIVLINLGLFWAWKKKSWKILAILVLLILAWGGYPAKSPASDNAARVALLQTNFTSGNPQEAFGAVLDLFKNSSENADIVIAPEGFNLVSPEIAKYILKDSYQIYLESKKNILFYWDLNQEKLLGTHNKLLLVPNGDYLPYISKALISADKLKDRFYEKGETISPVQNIGGTICSSILSPNIQRKMTRNGAEFLAVISSDAPFHGAKSLLAQNLAMSKLRAVENRRYFAQATNMGHSFLLNPQGKIVIKGKELGNKLLFADIEFIDQKTIYTRFGDWAVFLAILILSTIITLDNYFSRG